MNGTKIKRRKNERRELKGDVYHAEARQWVRRQANRRERHQVRLELRKVVEA